jgi:hypothetical protein
MRLPIEITANDNATGTASDATHCAVARGCRRELRKLNKSLDCIVVFGQLGILGPYDPDIGSVTRTWIKLPAPVQGWIGAYDLSDGAVGNPTEFFIDVPDSLAAASLN